MSILRVLFEPELHRRMGVEEMRRRIDADRQRTREARHRDRDRVEALEDDVGRLALLVTTIYRLLGEKGVITREEFAEAAAAIDAQDGTVDGRFTDRPPAR